jgi:putative transposase
VHAQVVQVTLEGGLAIAAVGGDCAGHAASAVADPLDSGRQCGSSETCGPSTPPPPEAAALDWFAEFSEKWEVRYLAIIRLWENAWAEFVPFLAFDTEIRTLITTTNAIESLNARFRRSVKARGHFPAEQAALKHPYLVIISLDPTGQGRQRESNRWKAALNAFDITFDGRLSAGGK